MNKQQSSTLLMTAAAVTIAIMLTLSVGLDVLFYNAEAREKRKEANK